MSTEHTDFEQTPPDDGDEEEVCTPEPVRDDSLGAAIERMLAKRQQARPQARTTAVPAPKPQSQRLNLKRGQRLLARLATEEALLDVSLPEQDSDEALGAPRAVAQAVLRALFEAGLKPEHLHPTDRKALLIGLAARHGWPMDTLTLGVADLLKDTVLPAGMKPMEYARDLAKRQPGKVTVIPLGSPRLTALAQWIGDSFWHAEHLPPTDDGRSGEDGFVPAPYLSAREAAKLFGCRPVDAAFVVRQLVAQGVLHLARPKTAKWAAHYSTDPLKAEDLLREYERRREERKQREAKQRRKQKPPRGRGVT